MFSLIKQVFIVLLSFIWESLARVAKVSDRTKCVSLNFETGMSRTTLVDLNPVELKYYLVEVVMCYLQKYVFQKNKGHKC